MKKICILFCGGTITMKRNRSGILVPFYNINDLLRLMPYLKNLADIFVIQLINIDSTNMDPSFWTKLAETIKKNINKYDGFVVTHGTDTMAYTASALSFALQGIDKSIVFTGSQKPLEDVPSDASNNLINSVIVASKYKLGSCIVFGQKILQGNRATKISESSLDPFDSPMILPLGNISLEPQITSSYRPKKNKNIGLNTEFNPNVIVIKITPGLSYKNLDFFLNKNLQGLILEGFGPGNIPKILIPFLKKAKTQDLPVIILSQCKKGITKMHMYEVGHAALEAGVLPGGDMTVEAASTKLMWILTQTRDINKVKQLFQTNIAGEITIYGK